MTVEEYFAQQPKFMRSIRTVFCMDNLEGECTTCGSSVSCIVDAKPYCFPHGYEVNWGVKCVEPTPEERALSRLLFQSGLEAAERYIEQHTDGNSWLCPSDYTN